MLRLALIVFIAAPMARAVGQRMDRDSPRMQRADAVREFLTQSDEEASRRFIEEHCSDELRSKFEEAVLEDLLRDLRSEHRGMRYAGILPRGPHAVELRMTRRGASVGIPIELESEEPFGIVLLGRINSPEWYAGMDDDAIVDALDEYVVARAERGQFSGAVLFARGEKVLYEEAFGMASRRFDVQNRTDTKFNLGSMNKMFTGLAICQLAERGLLSFEDKVGDHLRDYPNRDVAENVSIHQLLTHTSGMGSYWNDRFEQRFKSLRTLDDLIDLFVDDPLSFRPGTQSQYSNAGPVVLGRILEEITGVSYDEYVEENIHEPAGMTDTCCYEMDHPVPNLAIGYTKMNWDGSRADEWRNNYFHHSVKGGPAGGGFSTVQDLFRFSTALQNGELLGQETMEIMLEGKVDMGPGFRYAYLFGDHQDGPRYHGHNGGAPGINAEFSFYPEIGVTLVVLSNQDGGAGPVAGFARRLIRAGDA